MKSIQLKSVPQIAEPDLFRTLQSLPGVLTDNDFSTGLIVRWGNSDQNLILLDGITVYNPSHLGGVFSNFILDAIKEADFKKGGFNAEYGGRLSSVLNVKSREGNQNSVDGKASISLLAAQTTLEGPFYDGGKLSLFMQLTDDIATTDKFWINIIRYKFTFHNKIQKSTQNQQKNRY